MDASRPTKTDGFHSALAIIQTQHQNSIPAIAHSEAQADPFSAPAPSFATMPVMGRVSPHDFLSPVVSFMAAGAAVISIGLRGVCGNTLAIPFGRSDCQVGRALPEMGRVQGIVCVSMSDVAMFGLGTVALQDGAIPVRVIPFGFVIPVVSFAVFVGADGVVPVGVCSLCC